MAKRITILDRDDIDRIKASVTATDYADGSSMYPGVEQHELLAALDYAAIGVSAADELSRPEPGVFDDLPPRELLGMAAYLSDAVADREDGSTVVLWSDLPDQQRKAYQQIGFNVWVFLKGWGNGRQYEGDPVEGFAGTEGSD